MSPPASPPEPAPPGAPKAGKTPRRWFKPHTPLNWLTEIGLVALLVVGVLLVAIRVAPLTAEVRQFIEARVQGLDVGPWGKLRVEGLQGDIWSDFSVRKLTIADQQGVWVEADNLRVRWAYAELLRQRLHVRAIAADRLQLLRQPIARKQTKPPGKAPALSYAIDSIRMRAELAPAFSVAKGVYDADGALSWEGPLKARLDAESRLRPGDHFKLDLTWGPKDAIKLDADAREAKGGAISGLLGLAADQPFDLTAHLTGAVTQGKLQAVAHSGALVPLQASGAWSPKGGGISAHLVLGASHWTRSLEKGFGPEAQLAVIAKPAAQKPGQAKPGSAYDLDLRFITPNVVILGKGPFDVVRRQSLGMNLQVAVNDLHKFSSSPQMTTGRAAGTIVGDLADLRFSGSAEAHDLEMWGWRLQRVTGPVKVGWKRGELDVQGDLSGFGGSGSGAIAQFGGQTPTATVEVLRLKDGRVLIKSLNAAGRGVRVQGTGGQNLFKGLSFQGGLQVADLAQVLPGAGGQLDATWSASQDAGGDRPWVFTAEGRGKGMTTGPGEIDRLMGPDPKLTLAAQFQDGVIEVGRAEMVGAKERASAKGRWALAGALDFNLDWAAEGPFGFGPLQVDGQAHGLGKIGGTLSAPKAELTADFASIAFPQMTLKAAKLDLTFAAGKEGSDGKIALSGQSDYGAARASANFRFLPKGLDLTAIDADAGGVKAMGALSLRDSAPSAADLVVDIGKGVLLSAGEARGTVKITDAKDGSMANVDLTVKGAVLRAQPVALATARVRASGPLARLPYQITADGAWLRTPIKLDGSGVLGKDPKGYSVSFSGSGTLRRAPFRTQEPVTLVLDDGDRSARLRLALGGGQARLDARQAGGALTVDAAVSSVDLSFLSEDFTGGLDATVNLRGQGAALSGGFDAALKNARSRDARKGLAIDGQVKGVLQGGRMQLDAQLSSQQGLTSKANLVLPMAASAAPFHLAVLKDRPLQGLFQANGEIQPLWDLFLGGERTVGGKLAAQVSLAGTLADPKVTGRADLTDGLFDDYSTGLKLRQVSLGAALNTDSVTIDRFAGTDGSKGQLTGSGQVSLLRGGGGDLILNLTRFRLIDNDTAQADATGLVTLTRAIDGKARLAGTLEIVRGEVNAAARTGPNIQTMDVIEKNRPFSLDDQLARRAQQLGSQSTGVVDLDVTLKASRGVLIKGRGLDVDMSLDARVTGTTAKPVLSGQAQVVRGDYDFAGKRFEFDNRGLVILSNDPQTIRLDLTATRQDPALTAVIRIQGTAARPQITLSSTPILPNDEVLAQVLFGSSAAQLSPLEAAQLASALSALASGGGFDVVGNIRSFARLDRLALTGGNAATGFRVAGGKYITDNIYVEVSGGGRTGASAEVEYRVTRNLSLVSKLNDQIVTQGGQVVQGGDELSIRWRHDFTGKKNSPPPARREPSRPLPALPQGGGSPISSSPQSLPH